ncbi:MAG: HAMP domain-containing protein [Bradyrhizobiaceae bacterium]|nr:MAG: HAMP domain-containing protein [Bradyrhizobiaceae bacterium]
MRHPHWNDDKGSERGVKRFSFIRRLSLTQRLLALTLVASLPGVAALAYSSLDLRNTRYDEVRADALRNTHFLVSEVDHIFGGIEGALHAVSQANEIRSNDPKVCADYVSRVRAELKSITSIMVLNVDGTPRCYSEGEVPPINLSDRFYFREALATRQFAIGNYSESRISGRNIVPLALPVVNGNSVEYVVTAGLNIEWFGQQLRERGMAQNSSITIVDRNGIIVAREPDAKKYIGTSFPTEYMSMLSGLPGTRDVKDPDGVERVVGFVPAPETPFGLFVASGFSRKGAFAPIDRALRNSLLLFTIGTAVAFILAWLVGESIIRRPLMQMVATAEAWRRGQDAARTGIVNRSDEIGILGQTFDSLMDENERREQERELSEARREILVHELAHRVKNTLATVQSIASLSFRNSQGPEALRDFHERLQALVRSHDLLTRHNWENADLLEVAEAALAPVREDHAHRFSLKGPRVDLASSSVVPIAMVFHELSTNSMKYGALNNNEGRIEVQWTAEPDPRGQLVNVTWSEHDGPPVALPEREGFGTRLIKSLTQQLGGDVEMNYPPSGLVCKLHFIAAAGEARG